MSHADCGTAYVAKFTIQGIQMYRNIASNSCDMRNYDECTQRAVLQIGHEGPPTCMRHRCNLTMSAVLILFLSFLTFCFVTFASSRFV